MFRFINARHPALMVYNKVRFQATKPTKPVEPAKPTGEVKSGKTDEQGKGVSKTIKFEIYRYNPEGTRKPYMQVSIYCAPINEKDFETEN